MSLTDLGREIADLEARIAEGDVDAAVFLDQFWAALSEEERASVQTAVEQADLERWVGGRARDDLIVDIETSGTRWMATMFPDTAVASFAPHMVSFWEDWVWRIEPGERPRPRVEVWFRGGAKSSSAEAAVVALGARRKRSYCLYVCGTQKLADGHVETIGGLLESPRLGRVYPDMAKRAIGMYGNVRGWRRNRLWTSSGMVVDALGLQVAARGIRVETQRPDLIIFDDIDDKNDGPATIEKKIGLITDTLIPAGSTDVAILVIQNVIHPNSIVAQLAGLTERPADFLSDRIVIGPIPAVRGLTTEPQQLEDGRIRHTIVAGEATWEGYPLEVAQAAMDSEGITAFREERQHEVRSKPGGMFSDLRYQRCRPDQVPPLLFRTCWVDPAVTSNDGSDCQGIQIDGMSEGGVIYRLWSWEGKVGPLGALVRAIIMALRYKAATLGVETDQGGDTWDSVYREAVTVVKDTVCPKCYQQFDDAPQRVNHQAATGHEGSWARIPGLRDAKAGRSQESKAERASHMLVDYEVGGLIVHVEGTHDVLEAALFRFPKTKPFDLTDAAYWSWKFCSDKRGGSSPRLIVPQGVVPRTPISRPDSPALRTPIRSR